MSDHSAPEQTRELQTGSVAPINSEAVAADDGVWTRRLVMYLRIMAGVAMLKGLYHWGQVTGFIGGSCPSYSGGLLTLKNVASVATVAGRFSRCRYSGFSI